MVICPQCQSLCWASRCRRAAAFHPVGVGRFQLSKFQRQESSVQFLLWNMGWLQSRFSSFSRSLALTLVPKAHLIQRLLSSLYCAKRGGILDAHRIILDQLRSRHHPLVEMRKTKWGRLTLRLLDRPIWVHLASTRRDRVKVRTLSHAAYYLTHQVLRTRLRPPSAMWLAHDWPAPSLTWEQTSAPIHGPS
jgi:hypothetical protein